MKLKKLTDAYCYLKLKDQIAFDRKALKMLWLADKQHQVMYGRTVTGSELPITKLDIPNLSIKKCECCGLDYRPDTHPNPTLYGPFGELSRSDMITLDTVFLEFEKMTEEQCETFQIHKFTSLEEVFEGTLYSSELIAEIRENAAMHEYFKDHHIIDE